MAWEVYERIYSDNNFMTGLGGGGFVQDYPLYGAGNFLHTFIALREPNVCTWVFDSAEFDRSANYISDKLINNDRWRKKLYQEIDVVTRQYFSEGEQIRAMPLETLATKQLIAIIKRITKLQRRHHIISTVANGVVTDGRNHFSNKIRSELQNILNLDSETFNNYWSILTQITKPSLRQKKDSAIANLAQHVPKLTADVVRLQLQKLHRSYCWLDYQYRGPAATLETFTQELQSARRDNKNLNILAELRALKTRQAQLMRTLKLNRRARFLFNLAQFVIWQKGYRKDVQYHSFYCFEFLFREIARRKNIADWNLIRFLFPWELEKFVISNTPSLSILDQRRQSSCIIVHPKTVAVKLGREARAFWATLGLKQDLTHIQEVHGQCAYAGRVGGKVKIIQIPNDMNKMQPGDILISQATSPDLLPAMKKAAAIVTNTGGLICHAAITSRELKIPCIVGTINATQIFRDGDRVEVDATRGIIKRT